ncbi:uncharacterized protein LOC131166758 [Malania oleifera]|uniref:uncharacterized protein LOC131166758 n=1 Tax=Malania oleifera TaxID=397392 RepID=UPI0025AE37DB|nr:uncharacterized protein LOC131166758 [Malania oleifera]
MEEIGRSVRRCKRSPTAAGCTIERFTGMHLPTFAGGPNPIIAEDWVEKTERILQKQRVGVSEMSWSHFKEVFFKRYFAASTRDAKADEFSALSQGDIMVQGYATRYIDLSRFPPCLISSEYEKTQRFEKVLRKDIHRLVGMLQIREFSILADKATVIETDIREDEVD